MPVCMGGICPDVCTRRARSFALGLIAMTALAGCGDDDILEGERIRRLIRSVTSATFSAAVSEEIKL